MNPKPHKHAALIKQWAEAPDWWDMYCKIEGDFYITTVPLWKTTHEYELRKSAQHPDNIKPKKRLIDWSKMPLGTMTNRGKLIVYHPGINCLRILDKDNNIVLPTYQVVRLAEQTKFTYWPGGECPVPEGVDVEILFRCGLVSQPANYHVERWNHAFSDGDIIAYRITGLADGWTDVPEEAV